MIRGKHKSTLLNNDEELGMIHDGESIATDNHESTPLRQATTLETRRSSLSSRSTTVSTRRSTANLFGSSSRSSSHSWCSSNIVIKLLSFLSLVSWSTFVLSIRFVRTTPLSSSSSAKATIVQKRSHLRGNRSMKLSLWLIPSGDEKEGDSDSVYDRTQTLIDDLAAEHGGPKFMPHVTLGGATVTSEAEAQALAEKLRTGLSGYGPVNCYVGDTVLSEYSWNQALVFELVPPFNDFSGLCAASRKLLGVEAAKYDKDDCLSFPPPLRVPHMSLYYGISPPKPSETYLSKVFGSNSEKDRTFQSHRVMLWITDPSSLDGVPQWEPIADISLL